MPVYQIHRDAVSSKYGLCLNPPAANDPCDPVDAEIWETMLCASPRLTSRQELDDWLIEIGN